MIFNMVGGGAGGAGGGATLVVSSPANVSVTVSKDDKSYTKNSGSLGSATFKGLATGTWTVVISNDGQTATKTIEITADYAITLAFFSASINITYPANSTCVVTNSGGQTVASDTNTDSSAKTWTATVGATGTYTITATSTIDSSQTKSTTVSIATDGQTESVALNYTLYVFKTGSGVKADWDIVKDSGAAAYGGVSAEEIWLGSTDADGGPRATAFSVNTYNISGYTTINFDISCGSLSNGSVNLGIASSKAISAFVASARVSKTGRQTISVDISKVSDGNYYVIATQTAWPARQTIYNIWFS